MTARGGDGKPYVSQPDRRAAESLYTSLADRGLIPSPWSIQAFVAACEAVAGSQIVLCPQPADFWRTAEPGDCMTGMLLRLPNKYLVLYRENASPRYQAHQIAHEMAHLLFEHDGTGRLSDRQICVLFGDLFTDTSAVREALAHARAGLSTEQERQAEAFADLLLTAVADKPSPEADHARSLFGFRPQR